MERLEKYEGIRTGRKVSPGGEGGAEGEGGDGSGQWFKDKTTFMVRRCELTPVETRVAWFRRLKLSYDRPVSEFAVEFNLRRYMMAGFVQSFLVIVFIEIGDRTFFIAALMSVKHNQFIVFLGAFAALATMTIISTVMAGASTRPLPSST